MMKYLLALFLAVWTPAYAQFQTPNHAVPVGRGAGITGFGSAAPGAASNVLTSNGPGVDPSFQPVAVTPCASLPAGVDCNTLNARTSSYAVQTSDCGKTISLGGNTFYTTTAGAASGFPATCSIVFVNVDAGRGKTISIPGVSLGAVNILWPGQSFLLKNVSNGNVWTAIGLPNRWKLLSPTSIFVDAANGSDTNDGLAPGAGGALQNLSTALSFLCKAVDTQTQGMTFSFAPGAYNGVILCTFLGNNGAGYGQVLFTATPTIVTVPIASPGVVNWTAHGIANGNTVFFFNSGGALPTGISQGVPYFVINAAANTFQVSATSGGGAINFTGATSGVTTAIAPVKTQISGAAGAAAGIGLFGLSNTPMTFKGFQFVSCTVACIEADSGGVIALDAVDFAAAAGNHVTSLYDSRIVFVTDGYSITGGAGVHWQANAKGSIFMQPGKTVALGGTPAFTFFFAQALQNSFQNWTGTTIVGGATGQRYTAITGGGIDTGGGGANFLPGNVPGVATAPGWYQ